MDATSAFSDATHRRDNTLLAPTTRNLREKKFRGEDANEEQLNGLEGIRRLLMRVEAVFTQSLRCGFQEAPSPLMLPWVHTRAKLSRHLSPQRCPF